MFSKIHFIWLGRGRVHHDLTRKKAGQILEIGVNLEKSIQRNEEEEEQDNRPKQPAELERRREQRYLTLLSREQVEEGKSLKLAKWLKL